MQQAHVTKTRWEKGEDGDLMYIFSGAPYWTTICKSKDDFPMSAEKVAAMMNEAFQQGMQAKSAHMREIIGA